MGTLIVNPYLNASIVTDGLVLHLDAGNYDSYPGTGTTWTDLAGSNNGTLTNGPTYDSANGGSIVFDGVNDYVSIATSNIITGNCTIDIWLKADRTTHQWLNYPISIGTGTSSISFAIWVGGTFSDASIAANSIGGVIGSSPFSSVTNTYTSSDNNLWRNICVSYNISTGATIYKNNTLLSMFSNTTGTLSGNNLITVGRRNNNEWPWDGNIATVRIYNRALSASEINQNFQATRGRFGI